MFVVKRATQPTYQFLVMNRLNTNNLVETLSPDFQIQISEPYLLYRNAEGEINGIWFYHASEREQICVLIQRLTEELKSERDHLQRLLQGQPALLQQPLIQPHLPPHLQHLQQQQQQHQQQQPPPQQQPQPQPQQPQPLPPQFAHLHAHPQPQQQQLPPQPQHPQPQQGAFPPSLQALLQSGVSAPPIGVPGAPPSPFAPQPQQQPHLPLVSPLAQPPPQQQPHPLLQQLRAGQPQPQQTSPTPTSAAATAEPTAVNLLSTLAAQTGRAVPGVLSKSQLKATLLNLVQDPQFLDIVYAEYCKQLGAPQQ